MTYTQSGCRLCGYDQVRQIIIKDDMGNLHPKDTDLCRQCWADRDNPGQQELEDRMFSNK